MSSTLSACVTSLQSSINLLSSSVSILDSGVSDFPRLAKVLQTTRHFELLPESQLHDAQRSLLDVITPELESLLAKAEKEIERMARREQALIAKYELQQGRLGAASDGREAEDEEGDEGDDDVVDEREKLKLKQMRQKKERLSYAVERLTLQAQQRERQLRMSMATQ
jgi:DASH complex subunit SPC19